MRCLQKGCSFDETLLHDDKCPVCGHPLIGYKPKHARKHVRNRDSDSEKGGDNSPIPSGNTEDTMDALD